MIYNYTCPMYIKTMTATTTMTIPYINDEDDDDGGGVNERNDRQNSCDLSSCRPYVT